MRIFLLCLLMAGSAFAGDLAETGDLAPSQDLPGFEGEGRLEPTPQELLPRQAETAAPGSDRAAAQTYIQNQKAAAAAQESPAATITLPAGTIPGAGAIQILPQTGG